DAGVILYVGGIDQRKNWKGMLETVRRLVGRSRERSAVSPVLIMAGRIQDDRQYPHLLARIKELGLEDSVLLPGYLEDERLKLLCRLSDVFFFPSLYEGFGLPPLE